MKVEITEKGAHGADGKELAIGAELAIEGDKIPGYLVGKCRPAGQRTVVTNPAENPIQEPVKPPASGQERQALLGEAAKVLDEEHFNEAGVPDVREINALLDEGVAKFSAAERDALWPGIADAVKAAQEA